MSLEPAVLLLVGLAVACGVAAVLLLAASWWRARRPPAPRHPESPRRTRAAVPAHDPMLESLDLDRRREGPDHLSR